MELIIYGDKKSKIKSFAIISFDKIKNGFNKENLQETLDAGKYQYFFQNDIRSKEQYFFIFNISLNSIKSLTSLFNQESFIWGKQNSSLLKVYYYETDKTQHEQLENTNYKQISFSQGANFIKTIEEFYSKVKGFKCSFDFTFKVIPSFDQKALCDSIDDRYTGKSQYYSRIKSQRKP